MAKRLAKEYIHMENNPNDKYFIETKNTDLEWILRIIIDDEKCCYNNGSFSVKLIFPSEYPFKPPYVKFDPPIYHTGIHQETGEICVDLLKKDWGPVKNVIWVMETLYNMFINEGAHNQLNLNILDERTNNYELFCEKVKKQIKEMEDE